jgi:predicted TIM-barrel fold metal-dependent hydrolase
VTIRILSHCHVLPRGVFERSSPETGLDGTPVELVHCGSQLGFDRAVAIAPDANADDPDYGIAAEPNEWLAGIMRQPICAGYLIPFMRLNPLGGTHVLTDMEHWAGLAFAGIKIHPEIQRIDITDAWMEAFFGQAERLGLPILTHTGVLHGNFPLAKYEPRLFEPLVAAHPEVPLIMAHAGGAPYWRQVLALMQSYPNVYADLTGTLTPGSLWYIPPHELYLARDVGLRRRFIYGADWPFGGIEHVRRDLAAIEKLELPDEEKDGILGVTLAELLGLE